MVIFHSYVSLPEGSNYWWWIVIDSDTTHILIDGWITTEKKMW